jgi:hypothetical protein
MCRHHLRDGVLVCYNHRSLAVGSLMSTPRVLFTNPPWWQVETACGTGAAQLRQGIRAGSRWPFTVAARFTPGQFQFGHYLPSPYFLMSAAAWVQRAIPEAKVTLRDSIARGESYAQFDAYWNANPPTHVILEVGSASWDHDKRYIQAMKHSLPSVKIAVGGPPARELSKTTEPGLVDAWLLGEMEKPATRFVNGERGAIGFDMLTREELKTAPFPIFDEEVWWHYADANPKGTQFPELQMWASRGCNAVCSFCSFPATMTNDDPLGLGGRKIRFYASEWIEAFIRHRMMVAELSGHPLRSVRFDGDTENASDKQVKAICEVMRKIGLPWSMMCRADTTSREVWQEMKDSGCIGVKIGFESASDRVVNQVVKKDLNLKEAEETCRYLRSIGMEVHTTWMLGNPTETQEEMQLTIDTVRRFYAENVHTSHQMSGAATLTGTPLANSDTSSDPNFVRDPDGQHRIETVFRQ